MELWIRSQDKQELIKVAGSFHIQETSVNTHSHKWGILIDGRNYYAKYSTEKRALEVLDEIQKILKNTFIIKSPPTNSSSLLERDINWIQKHNEDCKFIASPPYYEIEAINRDCVLYEMPQE